MTVYAYASREDVDPFSRANRCAVRAAPDFDDVCYFVTHKIFTATGWGLKRLRKEEWKEERLFLKTHLRYAMNGLKCGYGDVHIVGEFVQVIVARFPNHDTVSSPSFTVYCVPCW